MTSRNTINIVLFLFIAILIAILFLDSEESTQTKYKLSPLLEKNINHIKITRITGESLEFKKNNNRWFMTSPFNVRANTFYIESLLQITQATSLSQFSISSNDKNKFKLNPPQATLKLNEQLFSFGTNEQINLNRYILSNKKLYLIPDRYFYILNSVVTGFIDHALIGKNAIITKLKLVDHDMQLINSKWQIKPISDNTSADDIVQLISEWNNSQAIEIIKVDESNSSDDITKNSAIEIQLKDNPKPIIFNIIKKDEFYLFVRRDLKLQFKLNHDMANRLLKIPGSKQQE